MSQKEESAVDGEIFPCDAEIFPCATEAHIAVIDVELLNK